MDIKPCINSKPCIKYKEIVAQIRSLKKLEKKTGNDFVRLKARIKKIGTLDYDMVKATIYRENFLYALGFAENMDGYNLLTRRLNRIKNPVNFYNFVKKVKLFVINMHFFSIVV